MVTWTQEQVQRLFGIWQGYYILPNAKKLVILRVYMTKVLGVSDQVAVLFEEGALEVRDEVGSRQGSVPCLDTRPFWEEVAKVCPNDYTEEDICALSQLPDIAAIFALLNRMEIPFMETTDLGKRLNTNAHLYK